MKSKRFSFVCLCCLFVLVLLSGCGDSGGGGSNNDTLPPTFDEPIAPALFIKAYFRSSHNSYSGNNSGYRGSIVQQLDAGIRKIELDIHTEDDDGTIKFQIGHDYAGHRVEDSYGNPSSTLLDAWLQIIADWSSQNNLHEPIMLVLDPKYGVDSNCPDCKNCNGCKEWDALNTKIKENFGDKLVNPAQFDPSSATLESLRGKIFVIATIAMNAKYDNQPDGLLMFNGGWEGNNTDTGVIFCAAGSDPYPDKNIHWKTWDGHDEDSWDGNDVWVNDARFYGKFPRLWKFTEDDASATKVAPNLPDTDEPFFGWYASYCETITETHPNDPNDTDFPKITTVVPDFQFSKVDWDSKAFYSGDGVDVDVAVNTSGKLVEVHKSPSPKNDLFYGVGKLPELAEGRNKPIYWLPENVMKFDTGLNPSVTINDNNVVVEVHESNIDDEDLYYRVGLLDDVTNTITWGTSIKYDTGDRPSVAINNDNMVVEMHQAHGSNDLWYNVGRAIVGVYQEGAVEGAIVWGSMGDYRKYDTGKHPSVAMYGNYILEAHNSSSDDYLWNRIGTLDVSNKKILWQDSREEEHKTYPYCFEDEGNIYPDVAFNGSSAAVVQRYSGEIRFRPGKPSNTVMAWGAQKKFTDFYSTASIPSVAMNKNYIVLFHHYYDSSYVNNRLVYRLGRLPQ